jgi:transposase-like protein
MGRPRKYPVEVRERAVWLARESERGITPVARDLGINPETLRKWVRRPMGRGRICCRRASAPSSRSCGGRIVICVARMRS